jgi:formate/nitrite transporter FocA (FNT family)
MKNLPWIIGALSAVVFFAVFESYALNHPGRLNTLSHAVATLGATWPLSIFLMGMFAGILAAHFFWPWKENPLGDGKG